MDGGRTGTEERIENPLISHQDLKRMMEQVDVFVSVFLLFLNFLKEVLDLP